MIGLNGNLSSGSEKKMKKIKRPFQHFDLVVVVWDDASGIRHGWSAKSESVTPYLALSTGFLISETLDHIIIAMDTDGEGSSNGRSQIPKGMIKNIRILRKKDIEKEKTTEGNV